MEDSVEDSIEEIAKTTLLKERALTDEKWTVLVWSEDQHDKDESTEVPKVTELPEVSGLPETQKGTDIMTQTDCHCAMRISSTLEKLYETTDSDNTSNDISVITESDKNVVNKHFSKTRQYKDIPRHKQIIGTSQNKIKVPEIATFIVVGILIGFFIGFPLTCYNTYQYKSELKNIKDESSIILNTYKEVTETLNEIRAYIQADKANRERVRQQPNINHPNIMSNKFTSKSLNYNPYLLDQFQISLSVLSSLIEDIHGDDSILKNEINKTLDIINDTRIFYEILMSFKDMQDMDKSAIAQFLKSAADKIHQTSQSLLSNIIKNIRNIILNAYNEYNKVVFKLHADLCHLKNPLLSELLKQLPGNSRFLKDHDKYCSLNSTWNKFNVKTEEIEIKKIKDTKDTSDVTSHMNRDKNIQMINIEKHMIDDISENSSDNIVIESQNICQSSQLTDSCSKFDTNMPIETTPMDEIGNHVDYNIINDVMSEKDKKVFSFEKIPEKIAIEETTIKQEDFIKSCGFNEKDFNYNNVIIEEDIPRQVKTKKRVTKSTDKHKRSFNEKTRERDIRQTGTADWQFQRSRAREALRQFSYFPKKQFLQAEFNTVANMRDMLIQDIRRSVDKRMRTFKEKTSELFAGLKKREKW